MDIQSYVNGQFLNDSPARRIAVLRSLSPEFNNLSPEEQPNFVIQLEQRLMESKRAALTQQQQPQPQQQQVAAPEESWWNKPLVDDPSNNAPATTLLGGTLMGMQDLAEGLTTPANLGMMGGMLGVAQVPVIGPPIAAGAGAAFAAQGLIQGVGGLTRAYELWDTNKPEALRAGIGGFAGLGMAGLGAKATRGQIRAMRSTPPPKAGLEPQPMESARPAPIEATKAPQPQAQQGVPPGAYDEMMSLNNMGKPDFGKAAAAQNAQAQASLQSPKFQQLTEAIFEARMKGDFQEVQRLTAEAAEFVRAERVKSPPGSEAPKDAGEALQKAGGSPRWNAPEALPKPKRVTFNDPEEGIATIQKTILEKVANGDTLNPQETIIFQNLMEKGPTRAKAVRESAAPREKAKPAPKEDPNQELRNEVNRAKLEQKAERLLNKKPATETVATPSAKETPEALPKPKQKSAAKGKEPPVETPEGKETTDFLVDNGIRYKITKVDGKEVSRVEEGETTPRKPAKAPESGEGVHLKLDASDLKKLRARYAMAPDKYLKMENMYDRAVLKRPDNPHLLRGQALTQKIINKGHELYNIAQEAKGIRAPVGTYTKARWEKVKGEYPPAAQEVVERYNAVHDEIIGYRAALEDVSEGKVKPFDVLRELEYGGKLTTSLVSKLSARAKVLELTISDRAKAIRSKGTLNAAQKHELIHNPELNADLAEYHGIRFMLDHKDSLAITKGQAIAHVLRTGWRSSKKEGIGWAEDKPILETPVKVDDSAASFAPRAEEIKGVSPDDIRAYNEALPRALELAKTDRGMSEKLAKIQEQRRKIDDKLEELNAAEEAVSAEGEAAAKATFREALKDGKMAENDKRWDIVLERAVERKIINTTKDPVKAADLIEKWETKYKEDFDKPMHNLAYIKKVFNAEKLSAKEAKIFDKNIQEKLLNEKTGAIAQYVNRLGSPDAIRASIESARVNLQKTMFSRAKAGRGGQTSTGLADQLVIKERNLSKDSATAGRAKPKKEGTKSVEVMTREAQAAWKKYQSDDANIKESGRQTLEALFPESTTSELTAVRSALAKEDPRWGSEKGLTELKNAIKKEWSAAPVVEKILGPLERLKKSFNETDAKLVKEGLDELDSHKAVDVLIGKAKIKDRGEIDRLVAPKAGKTEYDLTPQEIQRIEALAEKDPKVAETWSKVSALLERAKGVKEGTFSKKLARDITDLRRAIGETERKNVPAPSKTTLGELVSDKTKAEMEGMGKESVKTSKPVSNETVAHTETFKTVIQTAKTLEQNGEVSNTKINEASKAAIEIDKLDPAAKENLASNMGITVQGLKQQVTNARAIFLEHKNKPGSGGSSAAAPFPQTPQPKAESPAKASSKTPISSESGKVDPLTEARADYQALAKWASQDMTKRSMVLDYTEGAWGQIQKALKSNKGLDSPEAIEAIGDLKEFKTLWIDRGGKTSAPKTEKPVLSQQDIKRALDKVTERTFPDVVANWKKHPNPFIDEVLDQAYAKSETIPLEIQEAVNVLKSKAKSTYVNPNATIAPETSAALKIIHKALYASPEELAAMAPKTRTEKALAEAKQIMNDAVTGKTANFFAPAEIVAKYGEAAIYALGSKVKDFAKWKKALERNIGSGPFKEIPPQHLQALYTDATNTRQKVIPTSRPKLTVAEANAKAAALVRTFDEAMGSNGTLPRSAMIQGHQFRHLDMISDNPGVREMLKENALTIDKYAPPLSLSKVAATVSEISLEHVKATSRLSPQELMSVGSHLVALTERVAARTRKMSDDFNTYGKRAVADEMANLEDLAALEVFEGALGNNLIKAGQSLRVAQAIKNARLHGGALTSPELIQILRKNGWEGPELLKKLDHLSKITDPMEQFRYLKTLRQMSTKDIVSWFLHTNLMSGPKTLIRNLFGTSSNIAFDVVSTPTAAAFDAIMHPNNRSVYMSELPMRMKGLGASWREGAAAATDIWKNGFSKEQMGAFDFGIKELTPVDLVRWSKRYFPKSIKPSEYTEIWAEAISDPSGNQVRALNMVYRIMGATDAGLKVFAYNQARYGAAYSKARSMTPNPTPELITKLLNDEAIMKHAKGQADYLMYHDTPGFIAQKIIEAKAAIPPGQLPWVDLFGIPFVKALSNIMKAGLRATPWGFHVAKGLSGREAAVMNGRAALGSAILLPVVLMATQGLITGPGPGDVNKRNTIQKLGIAPTSVFMPLSSKVAEGLKKFGVSVSPYQNGYWVDYKMFQPLNFILSAVGNAADFAAYDAKDLDPDLPGKLALRAAAAVYDQSYLTGLNSLMRGMYDADKFGEGYIANLGRQLIPAAGLSSSVVEAFDPVRRHPDTTTERLKLAVPFAERPLPTIGVDGELQLKPMIGAIRAVNPVDVSKHQADPISDALYAADYWPGSPVKQITLSDGRDLTPEEKVYIAQLNGRWRWKAWGRLVQAPAFNSSLPPGVRKKLLTDTAQEATTWIGELAHLLPPSPVLPDDQRLAWLARYHKESHKLLRPWMIGERNQAILKEEAFTDPMASMRRLISLSHQAAKIADRQVGVSRQYYQDTSR